MASTAPLPLRPGAGVPAPVRILCRAVPTWRGAGRVSDVAFHPERQALLVLDGVVLVSTMRPSGHVVALALLGPGDLWLGDTGAQTQTDPAIRVDALGGASMHLPGRAAMLAAAETPAVAVWLAETQLRRALAAERRAAAVLGLTVDERIVAAFAELARAGQSALEDGRIRLTACVSQERLAWLAGTTRESANRVVASMIGRGELARDLGRYVLPAAFSLPDGAS
jgi:hypothetical protein